MIDCIPFFTIGIPVFNGEAYIKECIQSILSQQFRDFEIVCVDDSSKDNTFNILKEFQRKDKRIKLFKNKTNLGIGKTRQRIVSLSKSHFFIWVDADDLLENNSLQNLSDYMSSNNFGSESVLIQNAFLSKEGHKKNKYVYKRSNKPLILSPTEAAKKVILNNGSGSYPWTFVVPTHIIKAINYPNNCNELVDDQFTSFRYCLMARESHFVYYLFGYRHILHSNTDSNNKSFWKRLSKTYFQLSTEADKLFENTNISDALSLYSHVFYAIYCCKTLGKTECKDKLKEIQQMIKAKNKSIKIIKSEINVKVRMWVFALKHFPLLFYTFYKK